MQWLVTQEGHFTRVMGFDVLPQLLLRRVDMHEDDLDHQILCVPEILLIADLQAGNISVSVNSTTSIYTHILCVCVCINIYHHSVIPGSKRESLGAQRKAVGMA